ncbi:hypothetical protein QN379_22740 [Glaciimonas sp. Gout2]|uniref:hypothetical protein n=1 Tax=unclassified Glaciimonas TaxID=2644401 RepID=UPI002AB3EA76|nr:MULTISPECIES: hypothetical protein [unclassified Glaciimonas]MDY7548293.1 hypothetical protein [Glaciimonas sp. CA11.2]MEB0010557.1 hypothetical protein [Glaciimonas sp. Cout2]MEB0084831.1 hypothetical protein [Glaciimonas sp. Gout2]
MTKIRHQEVTPGNVLTFQSWPPNQKEARHAVPDSQSTHAYLIGVNSDQASRVLETLLPFLDQLLVEKTGKVREKKLEDLVEFMTGQLVSPSAVDTQMALRLATRRARILNEFGYMTAEDLAEKNNSRSANRSALADNWKKRHQVFSVSHRDDTGKTREVFPLFQFEDYKPIKAIQPVLEVFDDKKSPWKVAFWFASNNGWLPNQARPVDLLEANPDAILDAAKRETAGNAA